MSIDITTLLDEREITRSIFEFARAMDARAWDELHRIMTPDATAELAPGPLAGPPEVVRPSARSSTSAVPPNI